jgi:transposase, IS5 family
MPANNPSSPQPGAHGRVPLSALLDHDHPLFRLADSIEWSIFEQELGSLYVEEMGRPALAIRLMVGLHYLKYLFDESDESVVAKFVENPYWQYLCGCESFEHQLPCHPTSLVKWRRRVGADGIEKLLKQTIATAKQEGALKDHEITRVNVDTTVQEKAIAFPTDARLYYKARRALVRAAARAGIILRRNYNRVSRLALIKQARFAHAKQMKRARRETKRLKVYLGSVIRDLQRKCPAPDEPLKQLLGNAQRILTQQKKDRGKLYSVHAPEVECIAKGKAHKHYEFGCKVSVVTTSKNGWVVGIDAIHSNPYDGHTLPPAIAQVEKITAVKPEEVFADQGFKGKDHHPEGVAVYISGSRRLSRTLKKLLRRRSAIEPVIGHMKAEHGLERNYLLGKDGDRINAMLTGCAFNLRKLLRFFVGASRDRSALELQQT